MHDDDVNGRGWVGAYMHLSARGQSKKYTRLIINGDCVCLLVCDCSSSCFSLLSLLLLLLLLPLLVINAHSLPPLPNRCPTEVFTVLAFPSDPPPPSGIFVLSSFFNRLPLPLFFPLPDRGHWIDIVHQCITLRRDGDQIARLHDQQWLRRMRHQHFTQNLRFRHIHSQRLQKPS